MNARKVPYKYLSKSYGKHLPDATFISVDTLNMIQNLDQERAYNFHNILLLGG